MTNTQMSEDELINVVLRQCKAWAQEEMEENPDSTDTLEERWKNNFDTFMEALNEAAIFDAGAA